MATRGSSRLRLSPRWPATVGEDEDVLARHLVGWLPKRPKEALEGPGVGVHRASGPAAPLLLGEEGVEGPLPRRQRFVKEYELGFCHR